MTRDRNFIAAVQESYPNSDCLLHGSAPKLLVAESQFGRSDLFPITETVSDQLQGFLISNPQGKEIHLLAVDHCLFGPADPSRCDCIVFDDKFFCFVELKVGVGLRKSAANLNEARDQLGATIRYFRGNAHSIDTYGFVLEAYVVMRSDVYPKHSNRWLQVSVAFLEKYGVRVFERNEKVFEQTD